MLQTKFFFLLLLFFRPTARRMSTITTACLLTKQDARLAILQRVDFFEDNISANKISLPLRAGATLKENTITAPKI